MQHKYPLLIARFIYNKVYLYVYNSNVTDTITHDFSKCHFKSAVV